MSTLVAPPQGSTLARSVKAEWIKLTSIRSTWWTALSMLVMAIGPVLSRFLRSSDQLVETILRKSVCIPP